MSLSKNPKAIFLFEIPFEILLKKYPSSVEVQKDSKKIVDFHQSLLSNTKPVYKLTHELSDNGLKLYAIDLKVDQKAVKKQFFEDVEQINRLVDFLITFSKNDLGARQINLHDDLKLNLNQSAYLAPVIRGKDLYTSNTDLYKLMTLQKLWSRDSFIFFDSFYEQQSKNHKKLLNEVTETDCKSIDCKLHSISRVKKSIQQSLFTPKLTLQITIRNEGQWSEPIELKFSDSFVNQEIMEKNTSKFNDSF